MLMRIVDRKPPMDWNGHIVCMDGASEYAYCALCHVVRKAADYRHIAARECACPGGVVCMEGGYEIIGTHRIR